MIDISNRQIPYVLLGIGGLFFPILGVELLAVFALGYPVRQQWLVGVGITIPFVGGILYGGYWLTTCPLPQERFPRILRWALGGLVAFLLLNVPVVFARPPADVLILISWARWAGALGLGGGLLVGIFEARAIDRAAEASRESIRAEEAEAREQLLTYLNSLLRHEVLNTASVISGYAELLRDELHEDAAGRDSLATIERQATELTSVIEDVRVLLEATRGETDFEPIDLTTVIEAEVTNLRDRFDQVEVETTLPEQAMVLADSLVRRALANLLVNAVEHNDSPTTRVEVTFARTSDQVVVRIADNGPGIPPEEQEGLFELEAREGSSHGLGLGLVATLVARYGGTITLAETGAEGTTFKLELPKPNSV